MTITSSSSSGTGAAASSAADWLSPDELRVLEAVCDTFFPSLEPPAGSSDVVKAYYQRKASDLNVAQLVAATLAQENAEAQADIHQLLGAFASPVTGLMLAGRPKAFPDLSQQQREKYLQAMANSPVAALRQGYQVLKRLSGFIYFSVPDAQGVNPNWSALDYAAPTPPPADATQPIKPLTTTGNTTLDADVVVIGSGAGGGVVAGELAMAGKSVIVLEKGGYNNEANFTLQEAQAMPELYLKRGTLTSKDLGVIVLAGSTLGGGTTVNWMTSFRTPDYILEEWANLSGLRELTSKKLQDSFAAVEQRIHVNTENSTHNRQNQLLVNGCTALGYHSETIRRNAIDCQQRCGTCGFGCRYGAKQSTMKTYLQDAYEHGARIIVHCNADKVLIEKEQAIGVEATVTNTETGKTHKVTIHAKTVVVSAGAINSPALLMRSGVENMHLGHHLKLHPTTTIAGVYPDKVYGWQGVMQSAYSDQFAQLEGNYGYKLEVPPAHPGLLGLATPWYGAREYREQMAQAPNVGTFIVLTRDKGEGRITLDKYGEPVIDYVVSVYDRNHLLHGMQQATRAHFAAGATSVLSLQSKRTKLELPKSGIVSEQQFREFDRQLERHGMGVNRIMMFTAHQMGTCRMGADPQKSVTDGHGQVHGVKGLFVCDGSLFPAASGVNPMLSIMGLSHMASQYIKTVA
ncbi:MAG TPA: GMC family oxidoreductase N-terminal domain-containing protein [Ktedonobacteraceae bacterium]|nr:GMC family oxidoreductase N-terminal domain-containing protein [Ktedonobacteraceae bacterium]